MPYALHHDWSVAKGMEMRLFKRLKGLRANEKGNVLILTAAAMPLIIGSAGLAIDTIQLSLLKRHLQRAADSAALAGAYAKAQDKGFNIDAAVNKALTYNNAFPATAVIQQPLTGTFGGRSVRVRLAATRSLPFMSFFRPAPTLNVEATAALVFSGRYCMGALAEDASAGITFEGSSVLNANCGVISNTTGAEAVDVNGSATRITASPVAAVGGVPFSDRYQQPTILLPYSLKMEDPYATLPDPPTFSSCNPQITDSSAAPVPGQCYQGLDVNKAMTLAPGTYYLKGDLKLNANANITAHGVTLVFTSDTLTTASSLPKIEIDGNAKLDIVAPNNPTNPYNGIAMYYDRRAVAMSPGPKIEGNSKSKFTGAFYFPSQDVIFRGNSTLASTCIQLFAYRLTFTGNTTINNSCGVPDNPRLDARWVRLVG